VRIQRKGRGGKEVTVIEKLNLKPNVLDEGTRTLKHDLGCGGAAEGADVVLQGDQRDRAVAWLEAKGVRKVIRGS